jgi:membrane-bound lytic murein transglycosylase B
MAPVTDKLQTRLGFLVLGGVLLALIVVTGALLRGAGSAVDLPVGLAQGPAPTPAGGAAPATSVGPPRVSAAWTTSTAGAAGIPAPAVRAYGDAELTLRREQPHCHLSWNTLAGLGWVESQHGTIGSRTLGASGLSSRPVIGPALDGTGDFAAIRPTPAATAWHGDATWDHAVGPPQFLHSSWTRWGADGDGDGTNDPLDIDDAAYSAGRYLCADGHDLSTAAGWNAAIWSYNHDRNYVLAVLSAANTYASRINVR